MPKLQCSYRQAHAAAKAKLSKDKHTKEQQYECVIGGLFYFKVTIPGPTSDAEDIPIGTLQSIRRQLRLDREQFIAWRDCPMSRADYEAFIQEQYPIPLAAR